MSDATNPRAPSPVQASAFLHALGKDLADTRIRAFPHKESPNKQDLGVREGGWELPKARSWNREGRTIHLVIGNVNAGDDDTTTITSCPALFVAWDNQPIEWQLTAWQELQLPEPSIQVEALGSIHTYWVLAEAIAPDVFEQLQIRLHAHCKSDDLSDPGQAMPLPGLHQVGPDDQPTKRVELLNVTPHKYPAAQFEALLPQVEPRHTPVPSAQAIKPSAPGQATNAGDLPPRPSEALLAAPGEDHNPKGQGTSQHQIDEQGLRTQLRAAYASGGAAMALRKGLALVDQIRTPADRIVALQTVKAEAGLTNPKAFDQVLAALIDEQRSDRDCSLAELMARKHDATFIVDQFGAKGALVGLGGDKGDGKTVLLYLMAIAVASGMPLFGELSVQQGPALIVQCDESELNAAKKLLAIGADPSLPIHWMWAFSPDMLPELRRKIREHQVKVVGIDALTSVAGGRGIKSTDPEFALFLYRLNALAAEMGVLIVVLIHLRKPDSAKPRTDVTLDDFLGTGLLTAACSDVFGYWPNRDADAKGQYILRCLGKRNCEAGVTWDLQGCKDDLSLTFVGVQGGGASPSEKQTALERALKHLRSNRGVPCSTAEIAKAVGAHEQTIKDELRDYYTSGNKLKIQRTKGEPGPSGGRPGWLWTA